MKPKINTLYNYIENEIEEWSLDDFEILMDNLESLAGIIEAETCEDCGHRPSTGACFTCKMD